MFPAPHIKICAHEKFFPRGVCEHALYDDKSTAVNAYRKKIIRLSLLLAAACSYRFVDRTMS